MLAFLVAQSDFVLAAAVRQSALQTCRHYRRDGQPLWFQGHWGFQYYMAELGGVAQDQNQPEPRPGEFLAVPLDNANLRPPDAPGEELTFPGPRFLTTMNANFGRRILHVPGRPAALCLRPCPAGDCPGLSLGIRPAQDGQAPK